MTDSDATTGVASRRAVLFGAGALGATGLLAACGADTPATPPAGGAPVGPTTSGPVTVKAADVPVGGGTVLGDEQIVVTQPAAGTFRAFPAICTHQNCLVSSVSSGKINCPCHGSQFDLSTGAVVQGPATVGLTPLPVTVTGGTVTVER